MALSYKQGVSTSRLVPSAGYGMATTSDGLTCSWWCESCGMAETCAHLIWVACARKSAQPAGQVVTSPAAEAPGVSGSAAFARRPSAAVWLRTTDDTAGWLQLVEVGG